ncbi:SAP domain-containing ribonucleoprotein isoform X3 [Phodopus roborovskii]|uniref:SAP domain-containing ribonucleoprotein isoform X3 n=1 Tax=Phodopus roborovskii TaxID=109678 RepID=UPI0021E494B0|nr:SAP domain-containing ribonucleoprotein isoform X3 [Phodopus roborovskii]
MVIGDVRSKLTTSRKLLEMAMVAHASNPCTWEAEAGGSPQVQGQSDLQTEEEANEEDVLGDETEEEEPKPIELPVKEEEPPEKAVDVASEKKVVKITSGIPQTERMQKRAERFNVPVSLESKKAARAARFGISSVPTKGLSSDTKPMVNLDKLKERAQRFGLNVSSISRKSEDDEKLKKRKERFGIVTSSAGTGTTEDTEVQVLDCVM